MQPCCVELPGIEPVSGCWSLSRTGTEVRLLTGRDPSSPKWIGAHADGLVAILLPGLVAGTQWVESPRQRQALSCE